MKPADLSRTSKRGALARARSLFKQHLGWTAGFPVADRAEGLAFVVPEPTSDFGLRVVTVDGRTLSRARRAECELVREYAPVLPELVGPVDDFRSRLAALLALIKPAVHGQSAVPTELFEPTLGVYGPRVCAQARAIARRWPELAPCMGALSWSMALAQTAVRPTLAWLEENGEALASVAQHTGSDPADLLHVLVRLMQRLGGKAVARLLTWLGAASTYRVATHGAEDHLASLTRALRSNPRKRRTFPETRPERDVVEPLLRFTYWLAVQDPRAARRALTLFELTAPRDTVMAWDAFWAELTTITRPVEATLRGGFPADSEALSQVAARVAAHRERIPPTLCFAGFLNALRYASAPQVVRFHRALEGALSALPQGLPPDAGVWLMLHWVRMHRESSTRRPYLPTLLDHFSRYLRAAPPAESAWLGPFRQPIPIPKEQRRKRSVDEDILSELRDKRAIATFFAALARVHAQVPEGLDRVQTGNLIGLVRETGCETRAAAYWMALRRASLSGMRDLDLCRPAVQLTGDDFANFADVWVALRKLRDAHDVCLDEDFARLLQAFRATDGLGVLRRVLLSGQGEHLANAIRRWTLLARTHAADAPLPRPAPGGAPPPAWASTYPRALRPWIARLAAVHEDPRPLVTRALRKFVPDPAAIERELAVLCALGHDRDPRMARRVDNLRARLWAPVALSDTQTRAAQAKLALALDRAVFADWERRLDAPLSAAVASLLGVKSQPSWATEPRHQRLLGAVAELSGQSRALGLRVLRLRCGPPPWDLRDAADNRRFVSALAQRGVAMTPWIEGIGPRAYGEGELSLTLALEADPLELLHMGGHFHTCLSPNSFNFFSAITNAVDINKRVLYGRDRAGRVQGRCLLALTDAGHIVTFYAYNHHARYAFTAHARAFVTELASAMGVVPVPDGEVSTLLASEWYDDGAVDLTQRFPFLQDGSALRRALFNAEPTEIVCLLEQAFAPLPLDHLSLPLVLRLPEVRARPPVVRALLPALRIAHITTADCAVLARDMAAHGDAALAWELIGERLEEHLLDTHRRTGRMDLQLLALLTTHRPATALAVLRRTRPRRGWPSEPDGERLFLAAEAHRALRRPARAALLYALAIDARVSKRTACRARRRIAALRAQGSHPGGRSGPSTH